ncbi:MAG: ECF transporter S component [Ruminococcaceae bacterium]|nr:ECF transporter S component [Oscillospiraceae bacterium]
MNNTSQRLRRLTVMAMLVAIAYVAVFLTRFPLVPGADFLTYEPKDSLITIGAYMLDPLAGVIMTVTVSLLEMVTFSSTGLIGLVMNVFSSCLFVCTASLFYQKKRTLGGALLGLSCAVLLTTAGMLLWNYLITPLYMNVPRSVVLEQILPVFLPFNAIKCVLNAALTMLLYKSVSSALRATKLLPPSETRTSPKKYLPVIVLSALIVIGITLGLLAWKGMI